MKAKLKKMFWFFEFTIGFLTLILTISLIFVFTLEKISAQKVNITGVKSNAVTSKLESLQTRSDSDSSTIQNVPALEETLILVNANNPLPQDYHCKIVHEYEADLDQRVVQPYADMRKAALKDGISLWISSAYRDDKKQESLFLQAVQKNETDGLSPQDAEARAALSVARPKCSEHSTGLALDLNGVTENFDTTKEFSWLMQHGADYGFILRYPKNKQALTQIRYEPWHFRYVGVSNAKAMNSMELCLEEYVDYLTNKH